MVTACFGGETGIGIVGQPIAKRRILAFEFSARAFGIVPLILPASFDQQSHLGSSDVVVLDLGDLLYAILSLLSSFPR